MCFTIDNDEPDDQPCLGHALLWSMRASAIGLERGIPVEEAIERRLAPLGVPGAAAHLYVMMWILRHYAARNIGVDCVCARGVSRDEHRLLDVLAMAQQGGSLELLIQRHDLVSTKAAASLADTARRLMACFSAARQFLPQRGQGDGHFQHGAAAMPAATIH